MHVNIDADRLREQFQLAQPFSHVVIDNFFPEEVAGGLAQEFPDYESQAWFRYDNAIEHKSALNDWHKFPPLTYRALSHLNSPEFIGQLAAITGSHLYQDPGLHGGGWHIHGSGGNLNPHLDYSLHPKLRLQRKLNIIVYLSPELEDKHGGHLGLWSHDAETNQPGQLLAEVQPKFNRAILFDTTQNSWHGMSRKLSVPSGIYRKSLAVYYLTDPPHNVETRERALFAPREDQKTDASVAQLIEMRANSSTAATVYRNK
jgi:hypothetical protein